MDIISLSKTKEVEKRLDQAIQDGNNLSGWTAESEQLNQKIDAEISDVTAQLAQTETKIVGVTNLEQFPVIAPESNDNGRLQRALNKGGIISLEPNKLYKISSTLNVDVSKVRGIQGNKALIEVQSDIVALSFVGTHTGSAGGSASTKQEKNTNFHPFVRELHITSKNTDLIGTGIRSQGVFGLVVEGCHLYCLKHGIELIGVNRNIIIHANHIYNNSGYGIYYNNTDLHQSNITSNHISYCKTTIYIDNGDVHNVQIVGNDIELGYIFINETEGFLQDIDYAIHCKSYTGTMESFMISGNTIEDHLRGKGLIKLEAESQAKFFKISITGNELSNSMYSEIELKNIRDCAISGNAFKNSYGHSIKTEASVANTNISGNTFGSAGVLNAHASLTAFKFSNNTCLDVKLNPIVINTLDLDYHIISTQITDNTIHMNATGNQLTNYLVDIQTVNLENTTIANNNIRCRNYCNNGFRVFARDIRNKVMIKDNILFLLPSEKIAYTLPSPVTDNVIISGNI